MRLLGTLLAIALTTGQEEDLPVLVLGEVVEGRIEADSQRIETEAVGRLLGVRYALPLEEPGTYSVELRSLAFDAYLVVRDEEGEVLVEDDNGLLELDSMAVLEVARGGNLFTVEVGSREGATGEFSLLARRGSGAVLSEEERAAVELRIAQERVELLEEGEPGLALSNARARLGALLIAAGRASEAVVLAERSLAEAEAAAPPNAVSTAVALQVLATFCSADGDKPRALENARRGYEVLGDATGESADFVREALLTVYVTYLAEVEGCEAALPVHAERVAHLKRLYGEDDVRCLRALELQASCLLDAGRRTDAAEHYEALLSHYEAAGGPTHAQFLPTLYQVAVLRWQLSQHEAALAHAERCVELLEAMTGAESVDLRRARYLVGHIRNTGGHREDALADYREALSMDLTGPGQHLESLLIYSWIIDIQKDLDPVQARSTMREALASTRALVQSHPSAACARHAYQFSKTCEVLKDAAAAVEAAELALQAFLGASDDVPSEACATVLQLLRLHAVELGDCGTAAKLLEQHAALFEEDATLVQRVILDLEAYACAVSVGDVAESARRMESALSRAEQARGTEERSGVADWFYSYSTRLHDDGRRVEAHPVGEVALETFTELYGDEHAKSARSLNRMAWLSGELSDYERALDLGERALAASVAVHGRESEEAALSLHVLGWVYPGVGHLQKAKDSAREAYEIRERLLGPVHEHTLLSRDVYFQACERLGEMDIVEAELARSLREIQAHGGERSLSLTARKSLAILYYNRGSYDKCMEGLDELIDEFEEEFGKERVETLELLDLKADTERMLGLDADAQETYERILERCAERLDAVEWRASALRGLARLAQAREDLEEAEELGREALALCREHLGPVDGRTGLAAGLLADIVAIRGDQVEARELMEESYRIAMSRGEDLVIVSGNLGRACLALGELERATELLEQSYSLRLSQPGGEDHPGLSWNLSSLGWLASHRGDLEAAVRWYREAADHAVRVLGEEDPLTAQRLRLLGGILLAAGKHHEAEEVLQRSLELFDATGRRDSLNAGYAVAVLGQTLRELGRSQEAQEAFARSLELLEGRLGHEHPSTLNVLSKQFLLEPDNGAGTLQRLERGVANMDERSGKPQLAWSLYHLASALHREGRLLSALRTCERALKIRLELFGEQHRYYADSLRQRGSIEKDAGELESAYEHLARARDILLAAVGAENPRYLTCSVLLAEVQEARGELEAAAGIYEGLLASLVLTFGEDHARAVDCRDRLADLYARLGRNGQAAEAFGVLLEQRERLLPPDHEDLQSTRRALAEQLRELGRDAQALEVEGAIQEGRAYPPILTLIVPAELPAVSEERSIEVDAIVTDYTGVRDVRVDGRGETQWATQLPGALDIDETGRRARLRYPLRIPEGEDRTEAVLKAVNRRGLESAPETVEVLYRPTSRDLYVLAIGVADYDQDALDLEYPLRDVDDLIARFERERGGLYEDVHVSRLVNSEVTVGSVRRQRHEFLRKARPEDTILVFVAGHGIRAEDEYYFLTPECTADAPYAGIDRAALESLVTWDRLHAARRVLLIDSCHAGEKLDTAVRSGERGVPVVNQKKVDSLVDLSAGGLYVLAATSESGLAREADGNGLFTRALIDGMDGAADSNGNGYVEIEELKEYAAERVHSETGGKQRPTVPTVQGGENFPLVKARK